MLEKKNNLKAWLYLAPALILMGIFTFFPLFNSFYISFLKNYNPMLGTNDGFTFDNYVYALTIGGKKPAKKYNVDEDKVFIFESTIESANSDITKVKLLFSKKSGTLGEVAFSEVKVIDGSGKVLFDDSFKAESETDRTYPAGWTANNVATYSTKWRGFRSENAYISTPTFEATNKVTIQVKMYISVNDPSYDINDANNRMELRAIGMDSNEATLTASTSKSSIYEISSQVSNEKTSQITITSANKDITNAVIQFNKKLGTLGELGFANVKVYDGSATGTLLYDTSFLAKDLQDKSFPEGWTINNITTYDNLWRGFKDNGSSITTPKFEATDKITVIVKYYVKTTDNYDANNANNRMELNYKALNASGNVISGSEKTATGMNGLAVGVDYSADREIETVVSGKDITKIKIAFSKKDLTLGEVAISEIELLDAQGNSIIKTLFKAGSLDEEGYPDGWNGDFVTIYDDLSRGFKDNGGYLISPQFDPTSQVTIKIKLTVKAYDVTYLASSANNRMELKITSIANVDRNIDSARVNDPSITTKEVGIVEVTQKANIFTEIGTGRFVDALGNVFIIAIVSVPISIIIALLISVALNSITKVRSLFQTIYFLPYVTSSIAVGMAFAIMFQYSTRAGGAQGLINYIIGLLGGKPINWIGIGAKKFATMAALLIYTIWGSLAFKIVVFLSGLQGIDKQYYDAAKIDATPKWRVFTKITVPLLSPLILYISITSFIGAFKTYTSVVGLLGPKLGKGIIEEPIETLVSLVYGNIDYASPGALSRAAATAVLLFFIILIFTGLQGVISKKKVHY